MISTFTAFFDSNVFYGARLRSLILYLAQTGLFRAYWSEDVHREWIDNLLENRTDLSRADLDKTKAAMNAAVRDCLVENYEDLIPCLSLPDENDRHILAAAIRCHASTIVTFNQKDFPAGELEKYGLHSRHPDEFILDVIAISQDACMDAIQKDISHYANPPLTVEDYIASLERANIPETARFLGEVKIIFG